MLTESIAHIPVSLPAAVVYQRAGATNPDADGQLAPAYVQRRIRSLPREIQVSHEIETEQDTVKLSWKPRSRQYSGYIQSLNETLSAIHLLESGFEQLRLNADLTAANNAQHSDLFRQFQSQRADLFSMLGQAPFYQALADLHKAALSLEPAETSRPESFGSGLNSAIAANQEFLVLVKERLEEIALGLLTVKHPDLSPEKYEQDDALDQAARSLSTEILELQDQALFAQGEKDSQWVAMLLT